LTYCSSIGRNDLHSVLQQKLPNGVSFEEKKNPDGSPKGRVMVHFKENRTALLTIKFMARHIRLSDIFHEAINSVRPRRIPEVQSFFVTADDLIITTSSFFNALETRKTSRAVSLGAKFGELFYKVCKRITPYLHVMVQHAPHLIKNYNLVLLDSRNIECKHKEMNKNQRRTTNSRSIPEQLLLIQNETLYLKSQNIPPNLKVVRHKQSSKRTFGNPSHSITESEIQFDEPNIVAEDHTAIDGFDGSVAGDGAAEDAGVVENDPGAAEAGGSAVPEAAEELRGETVDSAVHVRTREWFIERNRMDPNYTVGQNGRRRGRSVRNITI